MSALFDVYDSQDVVAFDQTADSVFDPRPHFGKWLQSLGRFRNRTELRPGVYLENGESDFAEARRLDHRLPDEVCSDGTLVMTEQGKLQADVEVSVAVID